MGLPEEFAGGIEADALRPGFSRPGFSRPGLRTGPTVRGHRPRTDQTILVLGSNPAYVPPARATIEETLGHQYLLGIFPFTYLFQQHGGETFAQELILTTARDLGVDAIVASTQDRDELIRRLAPGASVVLSKPRLAVTAYDLIFVRMALTSAEIPLGIRSRFGEREIVVRKEQTRYLSQAQAPRLAADLSALVRPGLAAALSSIRLDGRRSEPSPDEKDERFLVLIADPRFAIPPPVGIGKSIATSYGFDYVPPFTYGSLRRLVQRGLHASAGTGRFLAASLRFDHRGLLDEPCPPRSLIVTSDIDELASRLGRIHLGLTLRARVCRSSRFETLSAARCRVEREEVAGVDGALAVTLETAARDAGEAFLSRRPVDGDPGEEPTGSAARCLPLADGPGQPPPAGHFPGASPP